MNHPVLPVVLQRATAYDRPKLLKQIDIAIAGLGRDRSWHGRTVLLKPNLISASGPALSCTHPQLVAAAAVWFVDHGARVIVGDSPAFGSAAGVLAKRGVADALHGLPIKCIEFAETTEVELSGGVRLKVAAAALQADLVVGLPKIKAHQQLLVTMAVKNLFGIVKGTRKALLHMRHGADHHHFAGLLLDLLPLLPAQLHLADALETMHQSGPLHGSPLSLHCLAAAVNPLALDTALLAALEIDPDRSPIARVAKRRGLAGSLPENVVYPHLDPADFSGSGFVVPEQLQSIRFHPGRFVAGMARRAWIRLAGCRSLQLP